MPFISRSTHGDIRTIARGFGKPSRAPAGRRPARDCRPPSRPRARSCSDRVRRRAALGRPTDSRRSAPEMRARALFGSRPRAPCARGARVVREEGLVRMAEGAHAESASVEMDEQELVGELLRREPPARNTVDRLVAAFRPERRRRQRRERTEHSPGGHRRAVLDLRDGDPKRLLERFETEVAPRRRNAGEHVARSGRHELHPHLIGGPRGRNVHPRISKCNGRAIAHMRLSPVLLRGFTRLSSPRHGFAGAPRNATKLGSRSELG